jgi:hypothetical protein
VVRTDCKGFRLYLFVIVIILCENNARGKTDNKGFSLCLCVIGIFI